MPEILVRLIGGPRDGQMAPPMPVADPMNPPETIGYAATNPGDLTASQIGLDALTFWYKRESARDDDGLWCYRFMDPQPTRPPFSDGTLVGLD